MQTAAANDALEVLGAVARDLGADNLVRDTDALRMRIAARRFYVVCIGQFKRGKSTLLNALLGSEVLPTGVVPVTAVPTIVRYGMEPQVFIRFIDGKIHSATAVDIREFVSEDCNPNNFKGVELVEVLMPAPLLRTGMCLVDTPGLGSVFESATQATRAFIPQIDAAVLVLGADPPITRDELDIAEDITGSVPHVIAVLAKADRVSDRERAEAADFAKRMLEDAASVTLGSLDEEDLSSGFMQTRHFYFKRFETQMAASNPFQWLADQLLPSRLNRARMRGAAAEFLDWLLEANTARVQNDIIERVQESRSKMERELRSALTEGLEAAGAAMTRARATRREGADALALSQSRLAQMRGRVNEARAQSGQLQ